MTDPTGTVNGTTKWSSPYVVANSATSSRARSAGPASRSPKCHLAVLELPEARRGHPGVPHWGGYRGLDLFGHLAGVEAVPRPGLGARWNECQSRCRRARVPAA